MTWQPTSFAWPLLGAAAMTAGLTIHALSRRHVPGARTFAAVTGSLTLWSLAYAAEVASATLSQQMFWLHVRYVGVLAMPPAWLMFCQRYTGHEPMRGRVVAVLAVAAGLAWLLLLTNPLHGLFWTGLELATIDGLAKWTAEMGPAYWVNVVWCYGLITAGSLRLVDGLLRSPRVHRGQAVCLVVAVGVPLAANVSYQLGWRPAGFLDPTPHAFTVSSVVMAWALFRYGFLELVPVARGAVVEGMSDPVVVLDPAERIVDLNPAARALVARDAAEPLGRSWADVFPSWPGLPSAIAERPEVRHEGRDGRRVFEVRVSEVAARGGRGRLVVLADVTARKRAEEATERQNEELRVLNALKTNFMIVTSHELRTPLTVLRGYHEALTSGHIAGEDAERQALTVCRRTVDRMADGLEDILEMLRLEEGALRLQPRPVDLGAIAREVTEELQPFVDRRRQRLALETDGSPCVRGDAARLRLVLHNLVENAIKFTPDEGAIRVAVGSGDGQAHVVVQDDGIGLEPAEIERVFDRFYAGSDALHHRSGHFEFQARGAGLGLSIVRGHVEAHGGRVWAESDGPGRGSRFHVVLPLDESG